MENIILKNRACRLSKEDFFYNFGKFHNLNDEQLNIPTSISDDQLQVIFEELLCAKFIHNKDLRDIFHACDNPLSLFSFDKIKIFDTNISAEQFINAKSASFSRVPLDNFNNNAPPSYMHLWFFDGLTMNEDDHRIFLDGSEIIPNDIKLFCSCSTARIGKISGKSWQLAGQLALKTLNTSKYKINLEDWIITGTCTSNKIEKIELGNKLDLSLHAKKWLLPLSNRRDIPQKYENMVIRLASTLDDAWSHITGASHKEGENLLWEREKYDECHMLIGGNIKAQMAAAILVNCNKIILWTSENDIYSVKPAMMLKEIIEKTLPLKKVKIMSALQSRDLRKTEQTLLNYFANIATNKRILFNVTSGNRIMSYAVQSSARLHPNIELIYKEQGDNKSGSFIYFNYKEFPPYSSFIQTNNIPSEYNWEFLNKSDNKHNTADDFIQNLRSNK